MEKSIEGPVPVEKPTEDSANSSKDGSKNRPYNTYYDAKHAGNYSEHAACKTDPDGKGKDYNKDDQQC